MHKRMSDEVINDWLCSAGVCFGFALIALALVCGALSLCQC